MEFKVGTIDITYRDNHLTTDESVITHGNHRESTWTPNGIQLVAEYKGTINNIYARVENNTFSNFLSHGLETINYINLTAKNNNFDTLITDGLGLAGTITGTYTNNTGGSIIAAAIGGAENITGTYKDNNSSVYMGLVGITKSIDATI